MITTPRLEDPPLRPNSIDRLRSIYAAPGPYTSVYLRCGEYEATPPAEVFGTQRHELEKQGASSAALDAIDARLALPVPEDVGGWAILAADDGSTVADFAAEGPGLPLLRVGELPVAAPLFEWDQWRLPHVTVSVADDAAEVVVFVPGLPPTIVPTADSPAEAAAHLRRLAVTHELRLIVIGGTNDYADALSKQLVGMAPIHTRVITLEAEDVATTDRFADAVVRYVADVVARDTVQALEDFRFLEAGGRAVQGADAVLETLAEGRGQLLLVHDDPASVTMASFGAAPAEVCADRRRFPKAARLADVAIWSAVSQGVPVRIIPTTGDNGPRENIGLTVRRTRRAVWGSDEA